jgi:hypothetical protein
MKCKECGLDYEVTTTTSETGDISLHGIHDAGGVDCLTRQLAAAKARIAELESAGIFLLDGLDDHWVTLPENQERLNEANAALLNKKGE